MTDKSDNLLEDDGNPDTDVDVEDSEFISKDFFSKLDASVNDITFEDGEESRVDNPGEDTTPIAGPVDVPGDTESLKKRYSDSSREAKRLNKQLQDVEPYLPILNAMKEDPSLRSHVREYYESGANSSENIKDSLGLDEDFIFDGDEAITDPGSDSGRALQAAVDSRIKSVVGNYVQSQQQEYQRSSSEDEFRKKHEMNSDEWDDYQNYAKGHILSYDDILYLKNREQRDGNIAKQERNEMLSQMKNARSRPGSVSTVRGADAEASPDDSIFEAIKGLDNELENAFS